MSREDPDLERLTLRFSRFRITIERAPSEPSSPTGSFILVNEDSESAQASTGPLAGEASASRVSPARSADTEFLAASTAEALAGLTLRVCLS